MSRSVLLLHTAQRCSLTQSLRGVNHRFVLLHHQPVVVFRLSKRRNSYGAVGESSGRPRRRHTEDTKLVRDPEAGELSHGSDLGFCIAAFPVAPQGK